MPYSEPYDLNTPPGNSGVAAGDDAIRQFKRAVRERMLTLVNWDADPITLNDNIITTAKIQDGAVATAKLADGAVNGVKLADGAVTTAKLADSAVSAAKIADGSVSTAKLANDAVETDKIKNGAVTKEKLTFAPLQVVGEFEVNLPALTIAANASQTNDTALVGAQLGDYVIGTPKTADSGGYDACVQGHRVQAVDLVRTNFLARGGPSTVTAVTWKFLVLRKV